MCLIFLSQKFIMQLLDSALFGSFLFFTLRSIRRSRRQSADQRQTENKKKRIKIWMTGMIFMIHRKPGFLNVKFVDKDFLCLKFSIANGIFRVIWKGLVSRFPNSSFTPSPKSAKIKKTSYQMVKQLILKLKQNIMTKLLKKIQLTGKFLELVKMDTLVLMNQEHLLKLQLMLLTFKKAQSKPTHVSLNQKQMYHVKQFQWDLLQL